MSSDTLTEIFFAECEELVESLISGLEVIANGEWDNETINAIFRAVHSIKGAAGAFGFENLVNFAHHYETVLDLIRSDKMEIDAEVLRLITRSSDILAELVDCSRVEGTPPPASAAGLEAELETAAAGVTTSATNEPVEEAEFTFAPISFLPDPISVDDEDGFTIQFRPHAGLYLNGHEPLRIFKALAKLGPLEVTTETDVPDLTSFDFEQGYVTWTLTLREFSDEEKISEIFTFVEGLCTLEIDVLKSEASIEAPSVLGEEHANLNDPSPGKTSEVVSLTTEGPPKVVEKVVTTKAATPPQPVQTTLRVDPDRVDRLINSVGELIINHAVISQTLTASGVVSNTDIKAALDDYSYLAREIQEGVMSIRAQPVKSLFQRMGRVVREAAEATGKEVRFVNEGEATEIDKTMLERLADPLTHMLRNAVDHGIEKPDVRKDVDKPTIGIVRLSAAHRSGHVVIEISDDGAGVNRERVLEKAVSNGIVPADAKLSDAEIDALLFAPGFSTAENVTNLSGRGVGMDVVKTAISSIGGKVGISSEPGKGSKFTISLPLTLAVLDGMIVGVGAETMVLPLSNVIETVRPNLCDIHQIGPGETVLSVRGAYVPVVELGILLGVATATNESADRAFVLVDTNGSSIAVAVDKICDQRQVVIKSLEGNYGAIFGIAAATILGDGKIALIIDPEALLGLAAQNKTVRTPVALEA